MIRWLALIFYLLKFNILVEAQSCTYGTVLNGGTCDCNSSFFPSLIGIFIIFMHFKLAVQHHSLRM
jgi:hypothetical protein